MIVLDTHVWLWWVDASRALPLKARRTIERAEAIGVSAISLWEVAMLVAKGRLELSLEVECWMTRALALPKVELLPIAPRIAATMMHIDQNFLGDPADRLVAATAISYGATLVTADRRLREAGGLRTVWE